MRHEYQDSLFHQYYERIYYFSILNQLKRKARLLNVRTGKQMSNSDYVRSKTMKELNNDINQRCSGR